MTKRRAMACATVLVGVALGVFVLLASLTHGQSASASNLADCSTTSSTTIGVTVGDNQTKLSVNPAGHLILNGGTKDCGSLSGITDIKLSTPSGVSLTTPSTLIDETANGGIPCAVTTIDGTTGVDGTTGQGSLQVKGATGKSLAAGVTGGQNAIDPNGCGSAQVKVQGMTSYDLVGGSGSTTLSAGGPSGSGFSGPATLATTLDGTAAAGPVTFVAGGGNDTFIPATTGGTGSILDFASAFPGSANANDVLTANSSQQTVGGLAPGTATVVNGTNTLATYTYSTPGDFTVIKGLSSGSTNFYPDVSTTYTLSGNKVSAVGAATGSYSILGTGLTLVAATGDDTFTVGPTGGAVGNNTFQAGPGKDTFYAHGTGNTMDFSAVLTSSSAPLAINLAGVPETVTSNGNPVTLSNGQAAVGSTVSYTFLDDPGSTDASNFVNVVGANTGNTQFLAGGAGGLTFNGHGTSNAASFLGNSGSPSGVVVNLSDGSQTTSAALSQSTNLNGFTVGAGQVVVGPPTSGATSCGTPLQSFCDSILDVGSVTGPSSGYSTFYAGATPVTFNDPGDHNTFIGGSGGTDTFSSAGNNNTFIPGSGSVNFNESTSSQGASNSIDFSAVPVGSSAACPGQPCSLVVNVSGSPAAVGNDQAKVLTAGQQTVSTYNFLNGGSDFTNFVGASGGNTSFDGGLGPYTYTGQGAGNTLDFSDVSLQVASSLTFDVTHTPTPQAILGQVPETFSGITNLIGLSAGNTQFQGGSTGGYTFKGNGSGNQATFTAQKPSTTLTVTVSSTDSITGGTVTFSLPGGAALCTPVPVVINSGVTPATGTATCSTATLPAGTNVIASYTPPAGTPFSGSGFVLTPTPGSPAFTSTITAPGAGTTETQGTPVTLGAQVSSGSALPAGTETFSVAGGATLCTARVTGGATQANPSCTAPFPSAGTFDLLAVYTPTDTTITGSAAQPLPVTVNPPAIQTTTTTATAASCSFCDVNVDATITNTASTANIGVAAGSVAFTFAGSTTPFCTVPVPATTLASTSVVCPTLVFADGIQVVAVYTPSSPAPVTSSAGSLTVGNPFFGTYSNTSLTSTTLRPVQGTRFTLQSVVSSGGSGNLSGGTVTFGLADGTSLCSIPVPSSAPSATLQCSASFSSVGSTDGAEDVIAQYSPTAGYGSASVLRLNVQAPTATTASVATNSNGTAGVLVNLSSQPVTSANGVSVGQGQVLVAAPPAATGSFSCSGALLPSYCDSLADVSVVNGSNQGNNTFVAGSGSETFGDTGTAPAAPDAIDFSNVGTSSLTPLTVNASVSPPGPYTATVGGAVYTFSTGGANFKTFTGSTQGNTNFLAGGSSGYTFRANGGNNSVDYSSVTSGPIAVDLHNGPSPATVVPNVTLATGTDTINGLTTVVGSSGGGNTFIAGPVGSTYNFTGNGNGNTFTGGAGTDVFTSNGSGNKFRAGTGGATFNDSTGGNTVDLSGLPNTALATVDVAGTRVGATANDTATSGGVTYDFTSFGLAPTTFVGSSGGTTFFAGSPPDTFQGGSGNDTLSFFDTQTNANGPLTISPAASTCPSTGQAVLGSVQEPFCGIENFEGLANGNTTFAPSGGSGYSFTGHGSNNTADFSAEPNPVTADLSTNSVGIGSSSDTISGVSTVFGSSGGGNTFIAGPGNETFGDNGLHGGDAIDFRHVGTSANAPLTVNDSGGPGTYTATVGSTTYSFTTGGSGFTTFTGSSNGNTSFLAGPNPGYHFTGLSGNNSVDLSAANTGVGVDLSGYSNANPVGSVLIGGGTDSLSGITIVTGARNGGNTFTGGGTDALYTFTGNSNGNTFNAGSGSAVFNGPGANNTINFAGAPSPLTVNVSGGGSVGGAANDTASGGGSTYTFTNFGTTGRTLKGSGAGGTTFYAGTTGDTFDGNTSTTASADTLSYADVTSAGPLTISPAGPTCPSTGQAMLGPVQQRFCGIASFEGLANGNTTFAPSGGSGYSFTGHGSNNTADFSTDPNPVTADLNGGTVPMGSSMDSITDVSTVFGSSGGGNTFIAGPGNETFGDNGLHGGDAIDFRHVGTSANAPLTVNDSGGGPGTYTATVGSTTYSFTTGGSGFTTFTGSSNGNTSFLAGPNPGYHFTGLSGNNSVDLSAANTGVGVDLSGYSNANPVGSVLIGGGTDSLSGITIVTGARNGGNTFTGGGTDALYTFTGNSNGNTFNAGSGSAVFNGPGANNTINFAGAPSPLTVNVSGGGSVGGAANDTASGGGSTYTFTNFGTTGRTLKGSGAGGTTFYAGTTGDTFDGNTSTTASADTLSYADVTSAGPLTISPAGPTCPSTGQAMLGPVQQRFCGIASFEGLANGNTTFAPSGGSGYSFTGHGSNNTADFSTDPNPVTADLNGGTVQDASGTDPVTGVTTVFGSNRGHNTFIAGSSNETFGDKGIVSGDTIDFSHVVTSSLNPLNVNAAATPSSNGVNSDTATVGSITYTFTYGGADFTKFTGAGTGYTKFFAPAASGATPAYTFCATPPPPGSPQPPCGPARAGDTVDFSANQTPITANLSPSPTTQSGLTTGQVDVGGAGPDTIGGMTTVVGSPQGTNTFFGGLTGTDFRSTSPANIVSYAGIAAPSAGVKIDLIGDQVLPLVGLPSQFPPIPNQKDSFAFSPGTALTVQGSPGNDSFVIGTTPVTLQGGGGADVLDLSQVPASSGTSGANVNLATGTISDPSIGGATFTLGACASESSNLCVGAVTGSRYDDTFVAAPGAPVSITGNGGNDTLDLSTITSSATVAMPVAPATAGTVTGGITFTGVPNVVGTQSGGDTFKVGSGTESLTEPAGATVPGTLDYSAFPATGSTAATGVNITANQGFLSGTASTPPALGGTAGSPAKGLAETFGGIDNFVGSSAGDTTLNLSGAPQWQVNFQAGSCPGTNNGTAGPPGSPPPTPPITFSCMGTVSSTGMQVYVAGPGQRSALNGGGNGTLDLSGTGTKVDLSQSTGKATFADGSYFSFTGMSTIDATDGLNAGANVGVTFANAPGPVNVNLSRNPYTVPAGQPGAGTSLPAQTVTGGNGTTYKLENFSNAIGTTSYSDILVAGSNPGSLIGGSGNDRFVMTGGDTFVAGGTGPGTTLDFSAISGRVSFNLGSTMPQNTGFGTVTVAPHSIHNLVASTGGSQLQAGNGTVTLYGGPGNDTLAGGNGTQTLIGGGAKDTLIAGVGNQTLQGGGQPVTFVPGGCSPNTLCSDTLIAQASGNTLDYTNAPNAAQVNLSSSIFPIPQKQGGGFLSILTATGGSGATVNLSQANITTVNGSSKGDILVTGSSGDIVNGNGGADLIVASGGNNFLNACTANAPNACGSPQTTFQFNAAGNNVITGGGTATVDFSQAPAGVTVDLQHGTASGGFGGSFQSLTGVLNAVGTQFNDTLIAGASGGTITGLGGGSDFLQSGPHGGDTLLSGGSASDTFCAASNCAMPGTHATDQPGSTGNTMTGGFGNDTFYARNGVVDTIDGGGGFNSAQIDANDIVLNNSIQNFIP